MPDINQLLGSLAEARFLSSIDLGLAYHQVDDDTKHWPYCFNRISFGLTTSSAIFLKLMFSRMLFKGVLLYLDDFLIYRKMLELYNERLEGVFRRIQSLKINPEKCRLSQIKEDGEYIVIEYCSRNLTSHESGYWGTRKELFALHEYVTHFRPIKNLHKLMIS